MIVSPTPCLPALPGWVPRRVMRPTAGRPTCRPGFSIEFGICAGGFCCSLRAAPGRGGDLDGAPTSLLTPCGAQRRLPVCGIGPGRSSAPRPFGRGRCGGQKDLDRRAVGLLPAARRAGGDLGAKRHPSQFGMVAAGLAVARSAAGAGGVFGRGASPAHPVLRGGL